MILLWERWCRRARWFYKLEGSIETVGDIIRHQASNKQMKKSTPAQGYIEAEYKGTNKQFRKCVEYWLETKTITDGLQTVAEPGIILRGVLVHYQCTYFILTLNCICIMLPSMIWYIYLFHHCM